MKDLFVLVFFIITVYYLSGAAIVNTLWGFLYVVGYIWFVLIPLNNYYKKETS